MADESTTGALRFLGAARNVTGSRYLLEAGGRRVLVDCGVYQERELQARNWAPFPVPPASLDAVLLTHGHLDHCGYLPRLVRDGFRGKVYCTTATAEIARLVMLDFAHLQEEDVAFKIKRHAREGRRGAHPEEVLYSRTDAENAAALCVPVAYEEPVELGGITASFHDAGHILGSAMVRVSMGAQPAARTLVFSGDIGRWNRPLMRDPTLFAQADYVVVESTYGDRLHDDRPSIETQLTEVINATCQRGGNVVIPSFAIERAQEVLYYLSRLLDADAIPHLHTFLDSPMAVSVTELFLRHPELLDPDLAARIRAHRSPFEFAGLTFTRSVDESKAINHLRGTAIVIAGAGMCNGGRIKHHLVNNIGRPESAVLFVGYQAAGTLGRLIVNGQPRVRILGAEYPVRARVVQIHGFSAHADRDEIFRWLAGIQQPPRRVFVTHGEPETAQAFAAFVAQRTGWATVAPEFDDQFAL